MEDGQPIPEALTPCTCPACGTPVDHSDPQLGLLQCPNCDEQFFAPDESDDAESVREAEARAAADLAAQREAELSEMRIHQISQLRRAATRSRSWYFVGVLGCWIGGLLFLVAAVTDWRRGLRIGPAIDLAMAVVASRLLPFFLRRIRLLDLEIGTSKLEEPQTPPDFSTLSDGSQQLTNLEEMAGRLEDP